MVGRISRIADLLVGIGPLGMELLVDLFGYLSIVLHGATILAQSVAVGGVFFWAVAARPLAHRLPETGSTIIAGTGRIAGIGALALIATELVSIALQTAVLVDTVGLGWAEVLSAGFALAGQAKIICALVIAVVLLGRPIRASAAIPLIAAVAELGAATLTTHAAARLSDRPLLLMAEWLHQAGAAIWIGGLPCFMFALRQARGSAAWQAIGSRFSRISMGGVGCIVLSGITMSLFYIGSLQGLYGTAYGVMVGAKIALFLILLGFGGLNFLLIEKLRADPSTPIFRLKSFAAVEFGIGISIFFAAASLTSVPPAVDLTQDRVTWPEIIERNTPVWPRLSSPDHDRLALPALQEKLDSDAAKLNATPQAAFVPGAGDLAPRNAADIAWSEYNHHWAGVCVALIGLLALLNQAGIRIARHWPLLFLGLAVFLFFRSDPETWPMGDIGFLDSLRDVEVLQHRLAVVLLVAFAVFEWRVRTGERSGLWAMRMFPLLCVVGGTLLLTHSHAIANVKDQLLIELTHTPLALAGIIAGWARWLEIELDPRANPLAHRIACWTWPPALLLCGLMLLLYREA